MLKWKYVQQGALMMFWNILDIYTIKSYFRNKYWYLPYQIAKCQFCTFALTSTTVYIGRIFRTNTIWDSTNQISNAIIIGITISLFIIAWTCTWTARPHIITTCTLNKNFLNIASGSYSHMTTLCEIDFLKFLWLIWVHYPPLHSTTKGRPPRPP